eukprot:TRINITY_DN4655_c0_g4_i1.p1 TRINITY_DN4655_c0_g4~~TRINITY_DN4655_c0_g4_i1.p1  ORF type:complete len:1400 (+),score=263.33 TRINITY_DN4655_c0_g4_i1:239-4438(+)
MVYGQEADGARETDSGSGAMETGAVDTDMEAEMGQDLEKGTTGGKTSEAASTEGETTEGNVGGGEEGEAEMGADMVQSACESETEDLLTLSGIGQPVQSMSREELEAEVEELRAAAALRLKEDEREVELQKNLLQSVGQAIICTDLMGIITYWNRAASNMYKWSEEEALGQNVMNLLRPASASVEEMGREIMSELIQGKQWTGEYALYTRENKLLEILVVDTPIMDSNGQLVGIIGVSTDITDLKRKEAQILQLNAELEERVVQRTQELELTNAQLRLEADQHRSAKEHLQHLYSEMEASQQKIEKQARYLETLVEELRTARREAESASSLKSRFLAHMSHEIRTPLNGVIGMTSLLLYTPLSDEQQDYVRTIKTSSDLLLAILNDILDLSKIEAGELVMEYITFRFQKSLEATIDLFAMKAREGGLELVCRIDPSVPPLIHTDPTRLQQVIINLISNATKFTSPGGFVDVSARAEPWDGPPNGKGHQEGQPIMRLHVAVRDSGIGIPASRRDRLFKPFSQIDVSTTRKFGGTGLGLAISKQLVENLGGQITVESAGTGHGSTFRFSVALYNPRPARAESAREDFLAALGMVTAEELGKASQAQESGLESESGMPAGATTAGTPFPALQRSIPTRVPSFSSDSGIPTIIIIVRHAVLQSAIADYIRHTGMHSAVLSWNSVFNRQQGATSDDGAFVHMPEGGVADLVCNAWRYDDVTEADERPSDTKAEEERKEGGRGEKTCIAGVIVETELGASNAEKAGRWIAWFRRKVAKEYAKQEGGAFALVERLSLILLVGGSVRMSDEHRRVAANTMGVVADIAKPIRQSQLIRALEAIAKDIPRLVSSSVNTESNAPGRRSHLGRTKELETLPKKAGPMETHLMDTRPMETHLPEARFLESATSSNALFIGSKERALMLPPGEKELESSNAFLQPARKLLRTSSEALQALPRPVHDLLRTSSDVVAGKRTRKGRETMRESGGNSNAPLNAHSPALGVAPDSMNHLTGGNRTKGQEDKRTTDAKSREDSGGDLREEMRDDMREVLREDARETKGSDTRVDMRQGTELREEAEGTSSGGEERDLRHKQASRLLTPTLLGNGVTKVHMDEGRQEEPASVAMRNDFGGRRDSIGHSSDQPGSSAIEFEPKAVNSSMMTEEEDLTTSARSMSLDLPNESESQESKVTPPAATAQNPIQDKSQDCKNANINVGSAPCTHSLTRRSPRLQTQSSAREVPLQSLGPLADVQEPVQGALEKKAGPRSSLRSSKSMSAAKLGDTHPLKILLVEDNAVNQKVARSLLQVLGYKTDHAWNGQEALEALRAKSYDLVFMDIQMPVMDGIEATRNILREWPKEQRPRIVAMTANVLNTDKQLCLSVGMDAFVSKPIHVPDLLHQLEITEKRGNDASS